MATASPQPLPLPLRPTPPRSLRIYLTAYWSLLIAFLALVLWKLLAGELVIVWENPWLGSFAFLAIGFLLAYRYGRTSVVRNFLAPHAAFICPRCHYGLRSLPDEGICPECGTSYTRASVVGLWEHTYRLPPRYPRVSARTAFTPPPNPAESIRSPAATSPWSTWTFPAALAKVEAAARRRGFIGARFPALAIEFDEACHKLARPLPADLHSFYAWLDPSLWTRFIHTAPAPSTPTPSPTEAHASWLADQPALTEHISIRRPADLVVATLADFARSHAGARAFAESKTYTNPWLSTQLIAFADSQSGATLFYCTDPPNLPRGSIITLLAHEPDRLWLADSLSQWLIRLAECHGVEPALDAATIDLLPQSVRSHYWNDIESRNPQHSALRTQHSPLTPSHKTLHHNP